MKLFLTSYRIPVLEELVKLIGKKPADTRVAIIPNAKDYYADRPRQFKNSDIVDYFKEIGFPHAYIVDLSTINNADELRDKLSDADMIWASGGNTFMLRHEMKRSGFDNIIRELLDRGVVYAGESAGALVAGNSLKGVEYADDPRFVEEVDNSALGLVDSFILPHVDSPFFADSIPKTRDEHRGEETMIQLTDLQALVVDGEKSKIVTGVKNEG